MGKRIFKRCPQYITERVSRAGTHSLQITIRKNGESFMKSIKISDFESPKMAMEFAKQLRDETLQKMRIGYTVTKLPTVREMYEATFESIPVRVKTKLKHGYFFTHGIEAIELADKPIDKITLDDVQRSINHYKKDHTKRQVNGLLAVWRRIYKVCAMRNINVIDRTVGVQVKDCAKGKSREKSISDDDLTTFINCLLSYNEASLSGHYYVQTIYYVIMVMKFTGMRPSEVFGLMRSDIDFVNRKISISRAVHSTETSFNDIGDTKNERSTGAVPIAEELVPILQEAMKRAKNEFLFTDYSGNLLEISDVDTLIRNVRVKKCPQITFTLYNLRHNFSTDLIRENVPLSTVRDLMRHSSQSMSLYYACSKDSDLKEAVNNRKFA